MSEASESIAGNQRVRADCIRRIIDDCLSRRSSGEEISDQSVIDAHPDLLPELEEELRKLRLIHAARDKANQREQGIERDRSTPVETDTESVRQQKPRDGLPQIGVLHIRCPLGHSLQVSSNYAGRRGKCPRCGRVFEIPTISSVVDSDDVKSSKISTTLDWHEQKPQVSQALSPKQRGLPKNARLGRFELKEVLGQGAYGTVYRARDPQLDRDVALKVPRRGVLVDEEDVARFLREARSGAQLRHPHIVSVHETGMYEDVYYIASSYVEGTTLHERIKDGKAFAPRESTKLVALLASALQHAHNKGIIHRDIKPQNVMLTETGNPQIMDFGLAHRKEGGLLETQEGMRMGTPAYMSPEQAQGESHLVDARSDIWSLGVVLYELLTGRRPFEGSSAEVIRAILEKEPVSPRKYNRSVPKDLETICLKCLVKNPEHRYASAQHLADDLNRWLQCRPILARRANILESLAKWSRRNPLVASAIGFAASLLVVATLYLQTRPAYWDVRVTPIDAKVSLDGEAVKLAEGRALVRCTPGRHKISVSAPNHARHTQDVVLVRGRDNVSVTNIDLRSIYGYIEADSVPQGASVELISPSGVVLAKGTTPFRSSAIRAGKYRLEFNKDMYLTSKEWITVPDGYQTVSVNPQELKLAVEGAASYEELSQLRAKLAATLDKSVVFEFKDTPLSSALEELAGEYDIGIQIDKVALNDMGISSDEPITANLNGAMALASALRLSLAPLRLTYVPILEDKAATEGARSLRYNLLIVTTQKAASRRLIHILHPVGDLIRGVSGLNSNMLLEGIQVSIEPTTWGSVGGPGSILYLAQAGALSIKQTMQVHLEIDEYLSDIRQAQVVEKELVGKQRVDTAAEFQQMPHGKQPGQHGGQDRDAQADQLLDESARNAEQKGRMSSSDRLPNSVNTESAPIEKMKQKLSPPTGQGSADRPTPQMTRPKQLVLVQCAQLCGHQDLVTSVFFVHDDKVLITTSRDKTVKFWSTHTGQVIRCIQAHKSGVSNSALSPDGRLLFTAGFRENIVKSWEVATGQLCGTLVAPGLVSSLSFSCDNQSLAAGIYSLAKMSDVRGIHLPVGGIAIWENGKDSMPKPITKPSSGGVNSLVYSPDGSRLAVGYYHGTVELWDVATWRVRNTFQLFKPEGRGLDGTHVAFSPSGEILAIGAGYWNSGRYMEEVKLWQTNSGNLLASLPEQEMVAFSPDGMLLVTGGETRGPPRLGILKVWDVATWQEIAHLQKPGPKFRPYCFAFSYDGKRLAIGGFHGVMVLELKRSAGRDSEEKDLTHD